MAAPAWWRDPSMGESKSSHARAAFFLSLAALAWFARGTWKNARLTDDERTTSKITEEASIDEGIR
jgi:hypothetical protein